MNTTVYCLAKRSSYNTDSKNFIYVRKVTFDYDFLKLNNTYGSPI